ncbi:hypothetical protein X777_08270 [Ooceraea biroi]|uniref:Uncharacterized protein n=1 Tax=Ooceraea biroi TaxID=2015173 RepID=A0A026WZ13_OOCBI|nr:hypothetical protein X777_08270 [Ooceraea biroi]
MTDSWRNSSGAGEQLAPQQPRTGLAYAHAYACTHTLHVRCPLCVPSWGSPRGIRHEIIQDGVRESGAAHLPALLLFQRRVYALRRLNSSNHPVSPLPEPPPGARINEPQRPRQRGI